MRWRGRKGSRLRLGVGVFVAREKVELTPQKIWLRKISVADVIMHRYALSRMHLKELKQYIMHFCSSTVMRPNSINVCGFSNSNEERIYLRCCMYELDCDP